MRTLLVPCSRGGTTESLWLASAGICDEEGTVVGEELLLEVECLCCVLVLCRVCDDALCDSLADGVDLRSVSTARNAHADVDAGEGFRLEDENLRNGS